MTGIHNRKKYILKKKHFLGCMIDKVPFERFRWEVDILIENWIQIINTHFILNFIRQTHKTIAVHKLHLIVGFCLHVLSRKYSAQNCIAYFVHDG